MLLIALLVFGFDEPDTVTMDVRDYFHVTLKNATTLAGSRRVIALSDHEDFNKKKKLVFVSLDDVGYLAPIGCTIEVKGFSRKLQTPYGVLEGIAVLKKEDIKVKGLASVVIPELTRRDLTDQKAMESREKALRLPQAQIPQNGKRDMERFVPQKKKTGVVLPGGKS